MTKQEAIRETCSIVGLVYRAMSDYTKSSDGFCDICASQGFMTYSNDGHTIEYVRKAVLNQLKNDGYDLSNIVEYGFDPETGREK